MVTKVPFGKCQQDFQGFHRTKIETPDSAL